METLGLTNRQETEQGVARLSEMLRFSFGLMRIDRIRNTHILRTLKVRCFGQIENIWACAEEEQRSEYIGRRMLKMELPGMRER